MLDVGVVTSGEHELVVMARALVAPRSSGCFESVEAILRSPRPMPATIGPSAMALLQEALAVGSVRALCERGGWQPAEHLGDDGRATRLWERHPPPALTFSARSFLLLRWLACAPVGATSSPPLELVGEATLADELLLYLACDLCAGRDLGRALAAQAAVRESALAWLGFPELLGWAHAPAIGDDGWRRWTSGDGAMILEALQPDLCRRWIQAVREHGRVLQASELLHVGTAEAKVLESFLEALESAGRRELATFIVDAAQAMLPERVPVATLAGRFGGKLDPRQPLSHRQQARRAAAGFLRGLARVGVWNEEHRLLRFFDEGYDKAQRLLRRWEAFGPAGFGRAGDVIRQLESLEAGEPAAKERAR